MRRVLLLLESGPMTVISLAARLEMDTSNLRRNLKDMQELNLVSYEGGNWRKTRLVAERHK